jgi:hypothetical protein
MAGGIEWDSQADGRGLELEIRRYASLATAGIGTRTRVTIYDANIDRIFLPGGDVWGFMEMLGRMHLSMALIEVPRRTGFLASQHNLAVTPYKKRGVRYSVGNYADHSEYVHQGTTGPIAAGNGWWDDGRPAMMGPMPPHMGRNAVYQQFVAGQTANPWIARSADIVLARFGYTGNAFPG